VGKKTGAFLTVISVIVGLIVAMATIQSTQASIDYWLEQTNTPTPGLNQIIVHCRNGGGMDGDFNLVVKFTNATFSTQTQLPYTQVDSSTVKIKFVLHKGDSANKTLFFAANGSEPFSISVSLQSVSLLEFIKANALFPTQLPYQWNATAQNYVCTNPQ
jgi:hypothetical protein